jgi:3'-5' exoribonuclease
MSDMKSLYAGDIRSLPGGQPIDEVVFALAEQEIRTTKAGDPYVRLTLADKTGSVSANVFDRGSLSAEYNVGDPLLVSGVFSREYNNLNVYGVAKFTGQIDPDDFLPSSSRDKDEMYEELMATARAVANSYLQALLLDVFSDSAIKNKFKTWPSAKEVHHAYIGGLLEHTLAVTKLCEVSAALYGADSDLLLAGAMLHDIGKLQELDLKLVVTYTDVGRLYGHSLLGSDFVRDKIVAIRDFPEQLRDNILHIIISHHGREEWGAAVHPMTLEAFLMHAADNTDAKATRYQALIEQQRPLEQNVGFKDYFLGTAVYAPRAEEVS